MKVSLNRQDLRALTQVGPPRDNEEPDPLAVLSLQLTKCQGRLEFVLRTYSFALSFFLSSHLTNELKERI